MTNGELIQACAGQCCARCDYHSECETFKRIYDRLPEELGFIAKKEGATAEVTLNLSIPIDEDWLNTEMNITLIKAIVSSTPTAFRMKVVKKNEKQGTDL